MITAIPLTLNLLILMGLYELAAGVAGLTGQIDWRTLLDEFARSPALTFMMGFMVYVLGAVVVLFHWIWTDPPAIIVSAIGCIAAVEGLLIMTAPGPLFAFSRQLVGNQNLISILAVAFGLLLIGLGSPVALIQRPCNTKVLECDFRPIRSGATQLFLPTAYVRNGSKADIHQWQEWVEARHVNSGERGSAPIIQHSRTR